MQPFVAGLSQATAAWLYSLTPQQRRTATWPFGAAERGNWHYAPRRREGLPLRAMTGPQREAARVTVARALSTQGAAKAETIMALETVLRELDGRADRDPLNYSFTVFGEPGEPPWGWRVEGHHLSVNLTVAPSGAVAVTPQFWGANPARIPHGDREGERVLGAEYQLGLQLAASLSAAQRADAVLSADPVGDIITGPGRARDLARPTGLACDRLGEPQRAILTALLDEYLGNVPDAVVAPYRGLVTGGLGALRLGWAGGMAEGEAFYYRLHGPRLLLEFDCTQNGANHVHSVWRDPAGDWGRDVLGEHYRDHHDRD